MARKHDSGKASALSEEYVIDSDSDGLPESDLTVQREEINVNGSASSLKKQRKDRAASGESVAQTGSVDEENDATDASSSSSEGASTEKASENGVNVRAMQTTQKKKRASTPDLAPVTTPAKPFRPTNGFQELHPNASDFNAEALEMLSGDLAGKQVWQITAPASVPLSLITELKVDAVRGGKPILVHNQRQYGFSSGSQDSKRLLLPKDTGITYKRLKMSISKSYHLREIPKYSQSTHSEKDEPPEAMDYFAKEQPKLKPPPEQPNVLRMRYKPFGTDDSASISTNFNENIAPEESDIHTRNWVSSSPQKSPPKEKRKRKKKGSKRSSPSEQNGPEDDEMQMDWFPAHATAQQEWSLRVDSSALETPTMISEAGEDKSPSGKKKRKKRKSQEEPS